MLALLCGAGGPVVIAFIAIPPAAVFLWREGARVGAMVAGAFDLNKAASTQLSGS
jgi:hypothetical protein